MPTNLLGSSAGLTFNSGALFNGAAVRLTDGGPNEARSFFTNSRFDITQFTTQFTFIQTPFTNPSGGGLTFTIQNVGPTAVGSYQDGLGYAGIDSSVAIKFDLYDNAGEGVNSTGIFTDGRDPTVRQSGLASSFPDTSVNLNGTGIDLHSQHPFQATLSYSGSILSETILDLRTGASFTTSYNVNLSLVLGGTSAFVGFTASSGTYTAAQEIQSWQGTFTSEASPLAAEGGFTYTAQESAALTNVTVATGTGTPGRATIDWGDGTTTAGIIVPAGGDQFSVLGSHLYAEDGVQESDLVDSFAITVTISDSTSVQVTDTALVSEEPEEGPGSPTITSFSPGSIPEGSSNVTLLVFGSNFVPGATVQWTRNGTTNLTTSYESSGELQAVVPAALLSEESNSIHGAPVLRVVQTIHGSTVASNAAAFTVTEAPLSASGGFSFSPVAGQSFTGTVATFVDTGGPQNPSDPGDYNATINWGDGATSSGAISLSGTIFSVSGSHSYSDTGTFTISVEIVHESAPPISVMDTAAVGGGQTPPVSGNGNVIITLSQPLGVLRIFGYNDDVVLTIQQSSTGVLEVAGTGTLVNQFSTPADFPLGSITEIDVTLLNGNDRLTMNNLSIPGNISVFAGSGSDGLFLSFVTANLINISVAGPGPDTVSLENLTAGAVKVTAGDNASLALSGVSSAGMVMLTAAKNATLSVDHVAATGDLDITLGDNAQTVSVDNSSAYNLNLLQTGTKGSPLFDLEEDTVGNNLNFNAGDANNTVVLSEVQVARQLALHLGTGRNSLSADHVAALLGLLDGGVSGKNIYVDGGGNSGLFVFDFVGHT